MRAESPQTVPPHGRLVSAGLAAVGAFGLALNHFMAGSQSTISLMMLAIGPLALFLGIGGVVEPKILWSLGKYGQDLPVVYKVIGGVLSACGLLVTALLLLFVYGLGPPR